MADRRMFAKTILESDAFTSMSAKAQCLYVHLCMNADDDGLMNNAMSVCRSLGFTKANLQELFGKRFLLDLGDGITAVKHWKINNYIQKDRYKPTIYQEKMNLIKVKEDGSYTDCIQFVYSLDTQDSIGKSKVSEEDIKIKEIVGRMLEVGYPTSLVDEALSIYDKGLYPKTADFFQKIINTLTDAEIYNKDGYIYAMAQNEVKA